MLFFFSRYLDEFGALRGPPRVVPVASRAVVRAAYARAGDAPSANLSKMVIAMYFPQFHEFEVNNRLWGKGYTDFEGVKTQRVARFGYPVCRPLDGYYDLRQVNARSQHGRLARHYGIHGFACVCPFPFPPSLAFNAAHPTFFTRFVFFPGTTITGSKTALLWTPPSKPY
jgi:hypothetical protein